MPGLPSGGDWALQRSGAITLEGTEGFSVTDSLFERVDGNGVMLNGCALLQRTPVAEDTAPRAR